MGGVTSVICEFDPLHTGHLKVINEAKKHGDIVLAVMSGNLTQRSETALFDKYARAAAAVECGCDLVVELPFPWSCAGAEFFAFGGVSVALALGSDSFVFGSECADLVCLKKAADLFAGDEIGKRLSTADKSEGIAGIYDSIIRESGIELGENDKLAANYIKAAMRSGRADIAFYPVKRVPLGEDGTVSGSVLRSMYRSGDAERAAEYIPPEALARYCGEGVVKSVPDKLAELEYLYFRFFCKNGYDGAFETAGGVGNLLKRAADEASSHEEFFEKAATKRYTNSRLRRAALFSMLGISKSDLASAPEATFLLACGEKGRSYLSDRSLSGFSLLTKPSEKVSGQIAERQLYLMRRADETFSLCAEKGAPFGRFLRMSPYIM